MLRQREGPRSKCRSTVSDSFPFNWGVLCWGGRCCYSSHPQALLPAWADGGERHQELPFLRTPFPVPLPFLFSSFCLGSCPPSHSLYFLSSQLHSPIFLLTASFWILNAVSQRNLYYHSYLKRGPKEKVPSEPCLPRVALGASHRNPFSQRARRCSLHLRSQHPALPPMAQPPSQCSFPGRL